MIGGRKGGKRDTGGKLITLPAPPSKLERLLCVAVMEMTSVSSGNNICGALQYKQGQMMLIILPWLQVGNGTH